MDMLIHDMQGITPQAVIAMIMLDCLWVYNNQLFSDDFILVICIRFRVFWFNHMHGFILKAFIFVILSCPLQHLKINKYIFSTYNFLYDCSQVLINVVKLCQ